MNGDTAMNNVQTPTDNALTRELCDALSELTWPERPPLAAITSRVRAHQRRRLAAFSGLAVTGAVAATVLALGLTAVFGSTPVRSTGPVHAAAPVRGQGTIRTGAFILTSNVNGTDTLTLTMSQMLNPATLQQALTQHGVPALVETGTYCSSSPAAPDPVSAGVLSGFQPPAGTPHTMVPAPRGPAPREVTELAARTVTVINPAAIPSGTELFFGYSGTIHAVFTDLIYTNSYTCSSNP
jgi:hypothetical protein